MTSLPSPPPLAARTPRSEGDQLPGWLSNQPLEARKGAEPDLITASKADRRPPPGDRLARSVDVPDHLTRLQRLPLLETLPNSVVLPRLPRRILWKT